jgi:hypothetical protein
MSETNFYLVPIGDESARTRGKKHIIVEALSRRGILDGYYDEELGWFAAGPRSVELFAAATIEHPAFEYAIVYDEADSHFVPDSHTGGFGSKCQACGAELDEQLNELLDEQGSSDEPVDVAGWRILCPSCEVSNALEQLSAEIPTAVTRFFINFCVVDSVDVNPDVMRELEELLACRLYIVPERL